MSITTFMSEERRGIEVNHEKGKSDTLLYLLHVSLVLGVILVLLLLSLLELAFHTNNVASAKERVRFAVVDDPLDDRVDGDLVIQLDLRVYSLLLRQLVVVQQVALRDRLLQVRESLYDKLNVERLQQVISHEPGRADDDLVHKFAGKDVEHALVETEQREVLAVHFSAGLRRVNNKEVPCRRRCPP